METTVKAVDLVKNYGKLTVVNHFDLSIEKGQLITLLGPSGCGKTTILRMIAGLIDPDNGDIIIEGQTVFSRSKNVNIPAEKRDIGMVFQSYAIWPHYTVFDNIAFPLKIRHKFNKTQIKEKVDNVLSLVKMEHLANRYPGELSGGQQQRVSLARALVYSPRLLLLDEPLANLDAQVRESVRFEIKELQRQTKVTTIYVTHDQAEAMVLSDNVMVMENGVLVQNGPPSEIYCNPKSKFVAGFIGMSNFIPGNVCRLEAGCPIVKLDIGEEVRCAKAPFGELKEGKPVLLCVRPEDFELHSQKPKTDGNIWKVKVKNTEFLGNIVLYWVEMGKNTLKVQGHPYFEMERNSEDIYLSVRHNQIKLIDELNT
jgi:iron(III) transport system ATP-binding protein